jgi:GNAT superfamily N-acetyltransferase
MALTIRPALATDARDIGNLAQQFAGYLRDLGDTSKFNLTAERYLQDGFGQQPAFAGIVAEDDGNVVAYLLYHFGYDSDTAARILHIVDLYVDRSKRRHGVGTALMRAAARIALAGGAVELVWSVCRPNTLAAQFYERLGAQPITELFFMKMRADSL